MENPEDFEACKKFACAIQDCIQKNNYDESKCQKQIDQLYTCCKLFYSKKGKLAHSVCCPKFSLLQLKLDQRGLGKIDEDKLN